MSKNNTPAISVKAKRQEGFWRAGFHFTREPREFAAGELTEAQHKAISQEPHLIVIETGETDAQRIAREKAEAKAADKANSDALAREKKATSTKEGKATWEAATKLARVDAPEYDDAAWSQLAASVRVARIEAKIAEGAK